MQAKMFILILMLFYVARVEAESLLGSSLNSIKTVQINQSQELKVKIQPHQQLILILNTQKITDKIEFDISSTASYQICTLNSQKQCSKNYVRHSKKDNSFIFGRQQITHGIKIKNPSITNKIKVVIKYHVEIQQCHRLQSRVLHRKQLKHSSCFLFQLDKQQDVELIIIKEQILDLKYQIQVCSKDYKVSQQNFSNNKFKINFLEIIKLCKQSTNMTLNINITHKEQNTTQQNNNPHIGLLLQYLQQSLLLPDGIAYTTSFTDHLNAKVFEYQLLNKANTTINVISDLSLQIYAKVVEHSDKDQIIPNKINCDFSSKTGFIFTYFRPYLLITKDVLQKYKCKDCYLVVSVWKTQNLDQIDKKNKFSIQITQHSSTLIDAQMKHHFLQTGAFAYYTFNSQTDSLTVYELADNNKHCAMFYLSDEEVPGPENYLKKSQKNKIMYKSNCNKPIFIGVKATCDCAYSISATSASTQFITLQKGQLANLNLLKDEIRYFIIQTAKCEYIKLLSLHIYGSVDIYINKTDITGIKQLKKDKIDYTKFSKKGQYMNRLVLSRKDEIFCEGCFYLVAVAARKLTQSTLFYGDEGTLIPIHDKTINDIIPIKGNKIRGEYFGSSKFELQVKIHSGKLALSINTGKQKLSQIYSTINVIKKQVVDLGSNSFLLFSASVVNLQTVEVLFEALQDNTIYSVRFNPIQEGILSSLSKLFKQDTSEASSDPLVKIQTYSLQPGHDLYLRISDQQITIVSGYFRDSAEKILLSSNIDESQLFSHLNLTLSVDGKNIQYKLKKMRNILTLQIPKLNNYSIKQGIKYNLTITLSSTGAFWLTIMQAEDFQLLSPHIYTQIHNSFTFVTHTQSDLIVELFQCKGRASLVYASARQKLDKNQNESLDIIGLPNQPHALRIPRLSTTFYKVTAQQAILRWFPFKLQDGMGTGYIDYKAGSLNYENTMVGIKFNWLSLSLVSVKNKTKARAIENISYVIYIATSQNRLSQYSQCQPFLITEKESGLKIKNIVEFSQSKKLNQTLSFSISKQQLLTKFGQNITLYATIVAELILSSNSTIPTSQKQRYRFMYPQLQVPHNLLHSSYIATVIESNYDQLISAVLVVLAAIVISTYLLVNKLMPVLGRLKNRYFVEENEQIDLPVQNVVPSEYDNQQVPQSSDRREIASTGQRIQIDEKS